MVLGFNVGDRDSPTSLSWNATNAIALILATSYSLSGDSNRYLTELERGTTKRLNSYTVRSLMSTEIRAA